MSKSKDAQCHDELAGRAVGRFHFDFSDHSHNRFQLIAVLLDGNEVLIGLARSRDEARRMIDSGANFPARLWDEYLCFQINEWVGPIWSGSWQPVRTNLRPRRGRRRQVGRGCKDNVG